MTSKRRPRPRMNARPSDPSPEGKNKPRNVSRLNGSNEDPTFRSYIRARRVHNGTTGDFLTDALHPNRLPECEKWEEVRAYLQIAGATAAIVDIAQAIWDRYDAAKATP